MAEAAVTGTAPEMVRGAVTPGADRWPVLLAVSAGGVVGAVARFGIAEAFPHRQGGFPWGTFGVNVSGCLLIGVLMVLVARVWTGSRLLRPFLGVGVLGGFTTFSGYAIEFQQTVAAGSPGTALLYLAVTMVAALAAVWVGATVTARAVAFARARRTVAARPVGAPVAAAVDEPASSG